MQATLVYWQNETSGQLAKAMQRLIMTTELLTEGDRQFIAMYLKIWLDYPGWQLDAEGTATLASLKESFPASVEQGDRESIWAWLDRLLELGIDPL